VTAAVPPTETASETETAIRTETDTTIARGTETVTTGPSAVTAASEPSNATATIDGTVTATATAREIANGTGTTGARSGPARILPRVDRMRKDVKRTQQKMGLPADASLNPDPRRGITRMTLRGAGGTMVILETMDAEMTDRRGAHLLLLLLGETRPLANHFGSLF